MKITLKTALACLATLLWLIPRDSSAQSESELRQFLHSSPNTYGWQPVEGNCTNPKADATAPETAMRVPTMTTSSDAGVRQTYGEFAPHKKSLRPGSARK